MNNSAIIIPHKVTEKYIKVTHIVVSHKFSESSLELDASVVADNAMKYPEVRDVVDISQSIRNGTYFSEKIAEAIADKIAEMIVH